MTTSSPRQDLSTISQIVLVIGCLMAFAGLAVLAHGDVNLSIDELAPVAPPGLPVQLFSHLHQIALGQLGVAIPLIVSGWGLGRGRPWALPLIRWAVAVFGLATLAFVVVWIMSVRVPLPMASAEEHQFHLMFLIQLALIALVTVGLCAGLLWVVRPRVVVAVAELPRSPQLLTSRSGSPSSEESPSLQVLRWVLERLRGKVLLLYLILSALGSGMGSLEPGRPWGAVVLTMGLALLFGVPILILLAIPAPYATTWDRRLAWGSVATIIVLMPVSLLSGVGELPLAVRLIFALGGVLMFAPLFLATRVIGRARRASGDYKVGDSIGTFIGLFYYPILGVFFVRKQLLRAVDAVAPKA